jgi:hypothetical protein
MLAGSSSLVSDYNYKTDAVAPGYNSDMLELRSWAGKAITSAARRIRHSAQQPVLRFLTLLQLKMHRALRTVVAEWVILVLRMSDQVSSVFSPSWGMHRSLYGQCWVSHN